MKNIKDKKPLIDIAQEILSLEDELELVTDGQSIEDKIQEIMSMLTIEDILKIDELIANISTTD